MDHYRAKNGHLGAAFPASDSQQLVHVHCLLCVVVLIGVVSESSALSVMMAVALMLISTILAQRQVVVRLLSSEWSRDLWQGLYWIFPKVFDLAAAMRQIIVYERDADWITPVWTSGVFGLVLLSAAVFIFRRRDF